ncbi:Cilia- and flagella-associated protein 206 [Cinara cedri]|uniref:Cilia- and flagella-associated protein 206 n=1 Tax=Cinara cedri TaxID=506608 RepID=A0A5E4MYL7_9HEMI|nr:Cilia- and flagella-associated protein 206 [Cinara cedri]
MSLPDKDHIQMIVKGCAERAGVQVSEKLASVFYTSLIVNPHVNTNLQYNTIKKPATIGHPIVVKIIDRCIDALSDPNNPVTFCIRMQLLLEDQYRNKEYIVNKINHDNKEQIEPILKEIIDDNVNPINNENSVYYRRIIRYIILMNHMGDPTSSLCIRETSAALNNNVIRNKLSAFENQLPCTKRNLLNEIPKLVCGIQHVNNMDRRGCRKDISKIIDILPRGVEFLLENIDQELDIVIKNVNKITSWTIQCYKVDEDFLAPLFAIRIKFATVPTDELNTYKIALVFYLQYKKNLEMIKRDLSKCKTEIPVFLNKYDVTLYEIRQHLKQINNFDKDIFPKLFDLSSVWNKMIETMNYLSFTANFITKMKQIANEANYIDKRIEKSSISLDSVFNFVNKEQQQIAIDRIPLNPMCNWYSPSSGAVDRNDLFANGYCLVMLVETNGILVKYNENSGIIQYLDDWFGFSCFQAALHFGTKPSYYVNCFCNLLRSQMHLLIFFNLYDQMSEKSCVSSEITRSKNNSSKFKDAQIQTIIQYHNMKTIGSINYAQEIKKYPNQPINNISNKAIQSVQTLYVDKSDQKQMTTVDVGCNTMRDKATNTN